MSNFCLRQSQGFEGLGGTPLPKLPLSAPTGAYILSYFAIMLT